MILSLIFEVYRVAIFYEHVVSFIRLINIVIESIAYFEETINLKSLRQYIIDILLNRRTKPHVFILIVHLIILVTQWP